MDRAEFILEGDAIYLLNRDGSRKEIPTDRTPFSLERDYSFQLEVGWATIYSNRIKDSTRKENI